MPDRRRTSALAYPAPADPLVAAARVVQAARSVNDRVFVAESWQNEAWGFFESLGEFWYGITWRANALSRVRLTAAELVPGGDEPKPLTDGPAAELVEQLGGGIGGRSAIMKSLGIQIGVPGEGWLVAERVSKNIALEQANWSVKSTDEIRRASSGGPGFEIQVDTAMWQRLPAEALVCRVWDPHPRYSWKANSAAKAAIPIMREIELYNRRIIATMVSRLAMNGLLLIPQEGTISAPAIYQDRDDPFVAMLIDIAARNIREPGAASASIPIPIRFPGDMIEKWKHVTFGDGVDEPLLKARDDAVARLATTLDMPPEVLTGVGDVSHWGQWQIEESAIKLHIAPAAETIVNGLTAGFLHPMLKAAGEDPVGPNGGKIVIWYDTSELTARPDKSAQAQQAYDRLEISGAALRRESGLDEADKPEGDELRTQILKRLVAMPANAIQALTELVGPLSQTPVPGDSPGGDGGSDGPAPPSQPSPGTGTTPAPAGAPGNVPGGSGNPLKPPGPPNPQDVAAVAARLLGVDLAPVRVPVTAGLRAPPVNGHNGHSRDGPRKRRR